MAEIIDTEDPKKTVTSRSKSRTKSVDTAEKTATSLPVPETVVDAEAVVPATETAVETEIDTSSQSIVLGPLDLAVTNLGANTHCNVSRKELNQNKRVVITYKTIGAKTLAQKNFAQLNALSGKARFKVEG
jgi:hypothetical protein